MTIREFYTLVGGSYDDMSERFPSDALILRFLTMLPQDGSMELLARSVDAADAKSAFRAVHTLKGVALNLGLTALAGVCSEMTEALRGSDTLPASAPARRCCGFASRYAVSVFPAHGPFAITDGPAGWQLSSQLSASGDMSVFLP